MHDWESSGRTDKSCWKRRKTRKNCIWLSFEINGWVPFSDQKELLIIFSFLKKVYYLVLLIDFEIIIE